MMKFLTKIPLLLAGIFIVVSCSEQQKVEESETQSKVKAIDTANFNFEVDPGTNFFEYVNGNWIKNNPIPDEHSRWGAFSVLYEENQDRLRNMFEDAAKKTDAEKGSIYQQMGDFYASGMDTARIEDLGYEPIKPMLDKIDAAKSVEDIQNIVFDFASQGLGTVIGMYVGPDDKNSSMNIVNMYQTGLSLPDKSYYLDDDERSKEIRAAYDKHIREMFTLIGASDKEAETHVKNIMKIETKIADFSKSKVDLRDPQANYNKLDKAELK